MIITLICWIYIASISFVYGLAAIRFLEKIYKVTNRTIFPFSVVVMLGIAVISSLTAYLSLFVEIGVKANLVFLLGALIFLTIDRGNYSFKNITDFLLEFIRNKSNALQILAVLSFALLLSFRSSIPPFTYDTGLYHSQAVQWIEKYPVVTGLGNLHDRLAFNSIWLLTSALFDFSFLFQQSLHPLNSLTLMIAILFSFSAIKGMLKGEINLPLLFQFLFLFPIIRLSPDVSVSSFSTDLPVLVLTYLILCLLFQYIEQYKVFNTSVLSTLIVALILFAVAVKLSTIPMVLFIPYIIYNEYKKNRLLNICVMFVTVLFVIAPHFMRNIILSGYLIYPLGSIDFFELEWKIPLENVIETQRLIASWARIPMRPPDEVLNGGFLAWFPTWFTAFKSTVEFQCLVVVTTIFLSVNIFQIKNVIPQIQKYKYLHFVVLVCLVFWFFSAPDVRFGYGFIWSSITILFAISIVGGLKIFLQKKIIKLFIIFFCVGLSLYSQIKNFEYLYSASKNISFLIFPVDYPHVETTSLKVGNELIYRPLKSDQCWNSSFPCTPYISKNLQLRGESLRDGFKLVK